MAHIRACGEGLAAAQRTRDALLAAPLRAALEAALSDADWIKRAAACRTVARVRRRAGEVETQLFQKLAQCMEDSEAGVREAAYEALTGVTAQCGVPGLLKRLVERVADETPLLRAAAAAALQTAAKNEAAVRAALLRHLEATDVWTKTAACTALAAAAGVDTATCAKLMLRMEDANPWVRGAACRALTEAAVKNDTVRNRLMTALRDPDPIVRCAALQGLRKAAELFTTAQQAILDGLTDRDELVRITACETLGEAAVRRPEVRAALVKRLWDASPDVAAAAARMVAPMWGRSAMTTLLAAADRATGSKQAFDAELRRLVQLTPGPTAAAMALAAMVGPAENRDLSAAAVTPLLTEAFHRRALGGALTDVFAPAPVNSEHRPRPNVFYDHPTLTFS